MQHAYFFGYGSLVNRRTHSYSGTHPATADGWRRAWRYTKDRQLAFLTVVRDSSAKIEGLVAEVPNDDWAALDERERAYQRLPATHQVAHAGNPKSDVAIYAIAPENLREPDDQHPVLLSYLDVVVQGFLQEFGAAGAERFFATTTGWSAPFVNDRDRPVYPRAQTLSDAETAIVDAALVQKGCRIVPG